MAQRNDGGPAFPVQEMDGSGLPMMEAQYGMSLRDYFAAKAMQGLVAQSVGTALTSELNEGAAYAYAMADAMLEQREN